jgi:hypothetical protein
VGVGGRPLGTLLAAIALYVVGACGGVIGGQPSDAGTPDAGGAADAREAPEVGDDRDADAGGPNARVVTTLASMEATPEDIAVDATNVYWTDLGTNANGYKDGTLNKVPLGGGSPTTLASGLNTPMRLAIDTTHAYWAETRAGTVKSVPLVGGNPTTLATGQNQPFDVAVDATNVYWDASFFVTKAPLAGGPSVNLFVSVSSSLGPIAVDKTNLYWADNGVLMTMPLNGGDAVSLTSGQSNLYDLAVGATGAYWPTAKRATVMSVPLGGGSPVLLASGGVTCGIAIDASSVYWTDWGTTDGSGTVMKVPLAGGSPVTLSSGQEFPCAIAVDATSVYWVNSPPKAPRVRS